MLMAYVIVYLGCIKHDNILIIISNVLFVRSVAGHITDYSPSVWLTICAAPNSERKLQIRFEIK